MTDSKPDAAPEATKDDAPNTEIPAGDPKPAESMADDPTLLSGATPDPLAEAKAEIKAAKDRYLRLAADFDNFRKRARRDVEDAERRGKENLLKELLPVFDNLERASVHAGQATEAKAVAEGVEMVLRQFHDTLGRAGVTRVKTVGEAFDPSVHEAIQQIESDEPAGSIVAEVQGGYALGDKLVRAAMVVVAKPRSS